MSSGFMDGRNSAMSEVGAVQVEDGQGRRMSDPVRPLDRNFGVGGQLSRHRSFGNLQGGGQRQALHQQRVRGQAGPFLEGAGGYQVNQVRETGGRYQANKLTVVLQGGLTQPQYPGQSSAYPARGYQNMPAQFQPGYSANNFNSGYGAQQGPQAGNNQIYNNQQQQQQQQQQQGFQPGYNQQHQGYGQQQQQQWYPGAQGYEQNNWSQQQQQQQPQQPQQPQQHMGWNTGMNQWSGQQQPNSWSSPSRQEGGMYPPQLPPHPQAQPHGKPEPKRGEGGAGKSNVEMQPEAYQRTLEYVQQCQSWSSNSVMSPDTTGAKHKRSPPHNTQDGAVMPPPPPASVAPAAPGAPGANLQDNSSNNMVIGDMTSSMNLLNEENRFLHLMQ